MSDKELIEQRKKLTNPNDLPNELATEAVDHLKEDAPEDVQKFYPNLIDS